MYVGFVLSICLWRQRSRSIIFNQCHTSRNANYLHVLIVSGHVLTMVACVSVKTPYDLRIKGQVIYNGS